MQHIALNICVKGNLALRFSKTTQRFWHPCTVFKKEGKQTFLDASGLLLNIIKAKVKPELTTTSEKWPAVHDDYNFEVTYWTFIV